MREKLTYFTLCENNGTLSIMDRLLCHKEHANRLSACGENMKKIGEQRKMSFSFSPQFAVFFPSITISVCREKTKRESVTVTGFCQNRQHH